MCTLDPTWVAAIAAIIAALAAVGYAFFTWRLIKEMRKDRKLAYKPIIKAILIGGYYPGKLEFRLKNVGKGPALNLKLVCKDSDEGIWKIQNEILPIGSLETVEASFVSEQESFHPGSNIFLDIEYTDILGKTYKDRSLTLDTNQVIEDIGTTEK